MSDLAARCLAECDRRDTLGAAATAGPWHYERRCVDDLHWGLIESVVLDGPDDSNIFCVSGTADQTEPDAALIVDARNSYDAATAAFRAILSEHYRNGTDCACCGDGYDYIGELHLPYPCPTVRAVAAALNVDVEETP